MDQVYEKLHEIYGWNDSGQCSSKFCHICKRPKILHHLENLAKRTKITHGDFRRGTRFVDSLPNQDLVLWNTLLLGYAEFGPDNKVLHCFTQIQLDALFPDVITLTCIVRACGNLKSIIGQKIHIQILLAGYENDRFIASMLVDMYTKCKYLLDACMVFYKSKHDGISWNALITVLLVCGYSSRVGKCIEKLYLEKIHVDYGIYVVVLKVCSSIYALNEVKKYILKSF